MSPFLKLRHVNIRKETAFINEKNWAEKKYLTMNGEP
jgi:hypothetical protein